MNEQAAFLRAIIAEPEDDTRRLACADWLEENGQPERAELIRVQCEVERLGADIDVDPERRTYLRRRERELLQASHRQWFDRLGDMEFPDFRRGFVESVTCTAADFLRHADELVAAHPVTAVTLTAMDGWDARIAQFDGHNPDGTFTCSRWPAVAFELPPAAFTPGTLDAAHLATTIPISPELLNDSANFGG